MYGVAVFAIKGELLRAYMPMQCRQDARVHWAWATMPCKFAALFSVWTVARRRVKLGPSSSKKIAPSTLLFAISVLFEI